MVVKIDIATHLHFWFLIAYLCSVKQLFAYLILASLVFLNVPRDLVHSHEHNDEIEHAVDHDADHHDHESEDGSFEEGHCFACEFDFDEAPQPFTFSFKLASVKYGAFVETKLNLHSNSEFDLFTLRGPPSIV